MFEQLDDSRPKMPMWQVWMGLILGAFNIRFGILDELRHHDHIFTLVFVANGVLFLYTSGLGWFRLRKGRK